MDKPSSCKSPECSLLYHLTVDPTAELLPLVLPGCYCGCFLYSTAMMCLEMGGNHTGAINSAIVSLWSDIEKAQYFNVYCVQTIKAI